MDTSVKSVHPEIELVPVMDLARGDWILLDNGKQVEVRDTQVGRHKDQMIIRLRCEQPLYVNGYWRNFIRRVIKAKRPELKKE